MSKRDTLLESITETIADYRNGEISPPTPEHVDTWIRQFDNDVQVPMLDELDHVFKQAYITKSNVQKFLSGIAKNKKLVGDNLCEFWKNVEFLDIQQGGSSQSDMLKMFDNVLQKKCDIEIDDCEGDATFIYLDDVIFTGNRVLSDLREWINDGPPAEAHVHVIVMAYHQGGLWYARNKINKAATAASKKFSVSWWRLLEIENRRSCKDEAEVFWPTKIPEDILVTDYARILKQQGYPPEFRTPKSMGSSNFFKSKAGRELLEQEFLKAGAKIRKMCPLLGPTQRPLGHSTLKTLGFGALVVTFRNCPNNAPLAFWAGDPWYPLFQRKTN